MPVKNSHGLVPVDNFLAHNLLTSRAQLIDWRRVSLAWHAARLLTFATIIEPYLHLEVFRELAEVLVVVLGRDLPSTQLQVVSIANESRVERKAEEIGR